MFTLITILHITVALLLIVVVLLQTGKGASIGAVFGGGSSHTLFGSRGAGNFLTKMTTGSAIVFMLTSLGMTVLASHKRASTITIDPPQQIEEKADTSTSKAEDVLKTEDEKAEDKKEDAVTAEEDKPSP